MAESASPNRQPARVGSSSSRPQLPRSASPDVFSAPWAKQKSLQGSKIMKALVSSGNKETSHASSVIDENTVYLEDLDIGMRG